MGFRALAVHVLSVLPVARSDSLGAGLVQILAAAPGRTLRTYTEAVQWFAGAHLLGQASRDAWEQVDSYDIPQWMGRSSEDERRAVNCRPTTRA
jgi:hypothetical protein